jgi:hypothetical protein
MNIKSIAVITALLSLTGCAANVSVMQADQSNQQQALSFSTKANSAKVYFVGGKTGNMIKTSMAGGAILFIDGIRIGQIDRNDVMVFDLKPKQYSFAWQYPSGDSQMQFLQRDVKAGDVIILEATWNTGGAGLGLLGLMASPAKYEINETYDRSLVMGKRVVVPQSCPQTLCN